MKKNIFRISIAVLFIAVVAACIFACNKEKVVKEQTNPTSNSKKALFTPESYNWIHSELSNATLNYLESLKEDENVNHDLLYSILLKTLNQKGLNYPLKKTIINERVLEYAMRIDDIFTIPYDFYVIEYQKIMNSMTNDYDLCYIFTKESYTNLLMKNQNLIVSLKSPTVITLFLRLTINLIIKKALLKQCYIAYFKKKTDTLIIILSIWNY